tara:strand:- start:1155 stop:1412 length:258 start_codon:yes stop_codon:yes gene_type:complete
MNLLKETNIIKYCALLSTAALIFISITIYPISRRASYWNNCLNKTIRWINDKEKNLDGWDKESKETLAVAVCNGAVYEPKLRKRF